MNSRAIQKSFLGNGFKPKLEFGGSLNKKSNPKTARMISTKHAMHLVLRSDLAKGSRSLLNFRLQIDQILQKQANDCQVKIYQKANAGNHLHLLIYLKSISKL